ncbi:MAG: 3-oxoacyl-[acyl-carrier-protein] reductase [Thermodesulfobacteriota bacterium]
MHDSSRVVVVTGGSTGIGRAVCLRFAREGATIVFVHYDPDDAASDETLALLRDQGAQAKASKLDVSSFADVQEFFHHIVEEFQSIDVLVNNAGITRDTLFLRMSEDQWDQALSVNLKGAFNCTKAAVSVMVKKRSGRIINISSVVGEIGNIGQANYAASKAGILGFTKSIAREFATRGITANAVAPGFINTEMTRSLPEKAKAFFLNQIPMGRMGEPDEVAEVVYWLASEGASYLTGQVIHVNGGIYM